MADAKGPALPVEVENLLREAQEVPLGPNDAKELREYIRAQAARIKELEARECREDRCEHVRNSAEATTQCLEYQGRIKALEAERDCEIENAMCNASNAVELDKIKQILGLDDVDDWEVRDAVATLKARCETLEAACRRQVENIERWQETGEPAGPEESNSIYEQLRAALRAAGE